MSVSLTVLSPAASRSGTSFNPVRALLVWQDRVRQRRQLRAMDDHIVRDIGLSRAEIEAEAAKPFWKA